MNAISVRGLTKRFGRVTAVNALDLDVPQGAAFGFIGPNGAGKTTLIKTLLGVCHPTSGEITILGGRPDDNAIKRRVGYLPERLTLPPAFTAVQFLRGIGRIKGLAGRVLEDEVEMLLSLVGLERSAWTRKCGKYSKGMRQRTGLAATMLGRPELLILDEPTDGIDPIGRAEIRTAIAEAHKRGTTIFLNSHLLAETERVCDHIAIVKQGKVVLSGSTKSLQGEDAFSVRFADNESETVRQRATNHGFVLDDDQQAFSFAGADAAALSHALGAALGDGLHIVEVRPKLKDLERIMQDAVQGAPQ